jgi:hypothetical protein
MSRKELPYYHPCSLESLSSSLTLPNLTPWRATTTARDPPLQYLCMSVLRSTCNGKSGICYAFFFFNLEVHCFFSFPINLTTYGLFSIS